MHNLIIPESYKLGHSATKKVMLFNLIVGSWEVCYFGRLSGKTKYFAKIMEIILAKQEIIIMYFHLFACIYIYP